MDAFHTAIFELSPLQIESLALCVLLDSCSQQTLVILLAAWVRGGLQRVLDGINHHLLVVLGDIVTVRPSDGVVVLLDRQHFHQLVLQLQLLAFSHVGRLQAEDLGG